MFKKKQKFSEKEIERLKEVAKEYNKLKKCLAIGTGEYDSDTRTYELVQRLELSNPIVEEMANIAKKVDLILNHLGLKYSDSPSLLKRDKCISTE